MNTINPDSLFIDTVSRSLLRASVIGLKSNKGKLIFVKLARNKCRFQRNSPVHNLDDRSSFSWKNNFDKNLLIYKSCVIIVRKVQKITRFERRMRTTENSNEGACKREDMEAGNILLRIVGRYTIIKCIRGFANIFL